MIETIYQNRTILNTRSQSYQEWWKNFYLSNPLAPSKQGYNITIGTYPKFVWFRVAKVATRSIYHFLHTSGVSFLADHPYNCLYSEALYRQYFKFAFVRHPVSRLISCWRNKVVQSNYFQFEDLVHTKMQRPEYFVDFLKDVDLSDCDPHIRRQVRLICLEDVDFVGRQENFEKDFARVCSFLRLEPKFFRLNSSKTASEQFPLHEFTSKDITNIEELYQQDMCVFGYCNWK